MHLQGKEFFERVCNAYEDFVMVDLEAKETRHLKSARILLR